MLKVKVSVIDRCEDENVDVILDYVVDICKFCQLPVDKVEIHIKEQEGKVEMIFRELRTFTPELDSLREDETWVFLALPMAEFIYYTLEKKNMIKFKPIRVGAKYKEDKWIYTFDVIPFKIIKEKRLLKSKLHKQVSYKNNVTHVKKDNYWH